MKRAVVFIAILISPISACSGNEAITNDRAYITCSKIMDLAIAAGDQASAAKVTETNNKCAEEMRKTQSRSAELFDQVEKCVADQTDFDGFSANCLTMLVESGL